MVPGAFFFRVNLWSCASPLELSSAFHDPAAPIKQADLMVFVYALGGGQGHLTRSLCFYDYFCPGQKSIFLISPEARVFPDIREHYPQIRFLHPGREARRDRTAFVRWLQKETACLPITTWITDTFPAGLFGELPEVIPRSIPCRILLGRNLQTHAYTSRIAQTSRSETLPPLKYSHILPSEKLSANTRDLLQQYNTGPGICSTVYTLRWKQHRRRWYAARRRDMGIGLPRALCGRTGFLPESCNLIIHNGCRQEIRTLYESRDKSLKTIVLSTHYNRSYHRKNLVCLETPSPGTYLPFARWIITGAGYNTMQEFGGQKKHRPAAFFRKFDSQGYRLKRTRSR
jgi:hypothetical protein